MALVRVTNTGAEVPPVELTDGNGQVQRVADTVKNIAAQAVTAGTAVTLHTPASGKKFRVLGLAVSLSVAGSVILKYGAGNTEFLRTPTVAAGTAFWFDSLGLGMAPGAVNDVLKYDVTANGNVSGFVLLCEE